MKQNNPLKGLKRVSSAYNMENQPQANYARNQNPMVPLNDNRNIRNDGNNQDNNSNEIRWENSNDIEINIDGE